MIRIARYIASRLRSRLVYRIFLPFCLIIVIGVAIALPYGITATSRALNRAMDFQVTKAADVVQNMLARDLEKLLTLCEEKVDHTAIREAVAAENIVRLNNVIVPMKMRCGVDLVVVVNDDGKVLLALDEGRLSGSAVADLPLTRLGLEGKRVTDIVIRSGRMFLCAVNPVKGESPQATEAVIIIGLDVDDRYLTGLKDITGADLILQGAGGAVVAATIPPDLAAQWNIQGEDHRSREPIKARTGLVTANLTGNPYRALTRPLMVRGRERATFAALVNVSGPELTKQLIVAVMITLTGIGLILSVFFSLLVATSVSHPVENLLRVTEATAAGDLTQRVVESGNDEISRLSHSFNVMIERIATSIDEIQKEKRRALHYSRELEVINSELDEARGQLAQASKMVAMGQLGAGIAHELNQPLLAIILFAEQTLDTLKLGTPEHRNVERILHQANRMAKLVNEIRLFARQSLMQAEEVDINVPVQQALALIDKPLADANIAMEVRLCSGIPPVMADENQLEQVFLNIMTNARDAMVPNGRGTLAISTEPLLDGQFVAIDISDDGVGIPAEILSDIFLPFFSTKKDTRGMGLGLSISYSIIERHSGTIQVRSQVGKGTAFRILLPTLKAKHCWDQMDCSSCRPGGEKELCPVYTREQGFFCWVYFQGRGEDQRNLLRCHSCAVYGAQRDIMYPPDGSGDKSP